MSTLGRLLPNALLAPLRAIARREREVRDTLWLLLTVAWILTPHLQVLPIWTSIGAVSLLIWRVWITWSGRRLPARWLLVALILITGVAIWLQFRTLVGKDAGVAYLVVLLCLKLLEMRARRDIFVVTFLCLFILLTSFFESQSIATAGHMLVALLLVVMSLISTSFGEREPSYGKRLRIALHLCLLAAPLMIVLFVLFPRVQGPLWGMPADSLNGRSGLSDNMAPGSISNLSQSNDIAFRVKFRDTPPPQSERYWRGPVFGSFSGRVWRPSTQRYFPRASPFDVEPDPGSLSEYTVTLEAHNQPWLFVLDAAAQAPRIPDMSVLLRPDLQVVTQTLIRERLRYEARSYTRFRYGLQENPANLRDWLTLPNGFNPRTLEYARAMRERIEQAGPADASDTGRRLVTEVLQIFRTQNYFYTLQPPLLGRDSVDEFLFDTRRGFCEHYAGAFVVLMRAMNVPARVVTGYQGGELNPVDQVLEIRQRDAHAWAEVWLADSGWLRVDPTAAVSPVRVEQGIAQALPPSGITNRLIASNNWLRYARFNWDAISNNWNQWVLSFNAERQTSLFEDLGLANIDWSTLITGLVAAFALVLAAIGASLLPRRVQIDPLLALYSKFCDRNARRGLGRMPAEGPREYLARIGPQLPAGQLAAAREITLLYEQLRYAPPHARSTEAASLFKTCVHAWHL